ncbi:UNVERIFIED_CONTAM: hypothetical protein NCL1_17088 [Trichonephila clavipes]
MSMASSQNNHALLMLFIQHLIMKGVKNEGNDSAGFCRDYELNDLSSGLCSISDVKR